LCINPGLAASLGKAGREEVERRFSLDAMVESYRQLYADSLVPLNRPENPSAG